MLDLLRQLAFPVMNCKGVHGFWNAAACMTQMLLSPPQHSRPRQQSCSALEALLLLWRCRADAEHQASICDLVHGICRIAQALLAAPWQHQGEVCHWSVAPTAVSQVIHHLIWPTLRPEKLWHEHLVNLMYHCLHGQRRSSAQTALHTFLRRICHWLPLPNPQLARY